MAFSFAITTWVVYYQAGTVSFDGFLSMRVTVRRNDETGQLLTAFNAMIARLKAMLTEVETLIQAVQAGRLDHRGEAQAFTGGWRDLVQGINSVVDAFVAPITMAARSIDRIAQGDIPDTITEAYQGDFNTIKDNLNSLIDATQAITQLAEALAAGNLDVDVRERSAQDTLMQAVNTMIHRLREVVRHVKSAANTIAVSSKEMSFSAEQMSQATLRVGGQPVSKGKTRVDIYLDTEVVEYFKARAGGRGYQTLINEALKEKMRSTGVETMLRRVIREELEGYDT